MYYNIIMKIIKPINPLIEKMLSKKEIIDKDNLRPLCFVFEKEIEEGKLLFNSLTKELLLLEDGEYPIEYLFNHRFLVPIEHDDIKFVDEIRNLTKMLFPIRGINSYTILTTTDCNARCFYCYEKGIEKISMDKSTALDVVDYIIAHKEKDKDVHLAWFGGEPLYNIDAINIITNKLKEKGINYTSSMISNGYLMDEETSKVAKENWNLKRIQITLDGTHDIYNRRKAYIYSDDAFNRVINNIHHLLDREIRVTIRLNLDDRNYEDLKELIYYLTKEFNGNKYLNVYSHLIFQTYWDNSEGRIKELYDKQNKISEYIYANKLARIKKLEDKPKINHCMADSGKSVVILPDGKLHMCEHINENETFGTIYDDKGYKEAHKLWCERYPIIEECKNCKLYATCIKLKHCPNAKETCLEIERQIKINDIYKSMQKEYKNSKAL